VSGWNRVLSTASLEEARKLFELGVVAGERALGRRVFREDVGDFWLIFETRPYMRARAALAATLWRLGRREEAVGHQRELLRLNPRDNQGLRYRQAHWLLALASYAELEQLFAAYAEDRVPSFVYAQALAAFARGGDNACARGLLTEARALNPHIPVYLTGRKQLPEPRPASIVCVSGVIGLPGRFAPGAILTLPGTPVSPMAQTPAATPPPPTASAIVCASAFCPAGLGCTPSTR
jgi:tetratricopeptide (TPR) repeat protein